MEEFFKDCSSMDELRKEYRRLIRLYHPDRGGDTAVMQKINTEYAASLERIRSATENYHQSKEDEARKEKDTATVPHDEAPPTTIKKRKKWHIFVAVLAVVLIATGSFAGGYIAAMRRNASLTVNTSALQEPMTGQLFIYPQRNVDTSILSISTFGDDGHYFVLTDSVTGQPKMSFYVRPGAQASLDVPLGTYEIYIAAGSKWYGQDRLFAGDTQYFKMPGVYKSEMVQGEPKTKICWVGAKGLSNEVSVLPSEFPQ